MWVWYVGRQVWIFIKIHFLEAENRTRRYIGSRNLLIILAFHNETYVCSRGQVYSEKREFSEIFVPQKPRYTKEILFLFQQFGLKYWPIKIKELFLVNGCKVADIKFQQIPYNWRINTATSYIFLYIGALSNLPTPTIFASFVKLWLQWKLWILSNIPLLQPDLPSEDSLLFM